MIPIFLRCLHKYVRLRFPLFGGWKTNYIMGYNLPSYEYLFADGDKLAPFQYYSIACNLVTNIFMATLFRFVLKMRLLDHIYDGMVVEKLTTKIVLPEKASYVYFNIVCKLVMTYILL